jgi:hypothetical protein
MPKYKYVGKVDFLEPKLKIGLIKPNEIVETINPIPQYLLKLGLFEVIDENNPPVKEDKVLEFTLNPNEEIEVDTENDFYNYIQIQVLPTEQYNKELIDGTNNNENLIVDVYQNVKSEDTKLVADLFTIIEISHINTLNKNVYKLILHARDTNKYGCIVRIHLYRHFQVIERTK